ncbi:MAG: ABC transporter permease [Zoogloeaceae bacterium]|nr:ABC transporter permease [Zoogloeaceae bacterium]
MSTPALAQEGEEIRLSGIWTLAALAAWPAGETSALQRRLRALAQQGGRWNLARVERLDSAVALLLWQCWGKRWPDAIEIPPRFAEQLERIAAFRPAAESPEPLFPLPQKAASFGALVRRVGVFTLFVLHNLAGVLELQGRLALDLFFLSRHPREIPWKELSANVYKTGAQALPVLALMGFLIGITISYLSALQLKLYGADMFIVNILGISIIRELGPVLVAVLVAGRSGSAMTAQIGVMRVTEEIDALATFGVSRTIRVVLPKVAALTLVMPLLVVWSCAAALVGGALAARLQLDLSFVYFFNMLPRTVPLANLWIGLAKGMVFGFLIALLACQFGLHVRPNTESLSLRTTASVVTAITLVILADALFAVFTRHIGIPSG